MRVLFITSSFFGNAIAAFLYLFIFMFPFGVIEIIPSQLLSNQDVAEFSPWLPLHFTKVIIYISKEKTRIHENKRGTSPTDAPPIFICYVKKLRLPCTFLLRTSTITRSLQDSCIVVQYTYVDRPQNLVSFSRLVKYRIIFE